MIGFDMETDVGSSSTLYTGVQEGTPAIIKVLEKNGAQGTFLFTGDCVQKNRNIVEEVHKKGFEIGCHSLFHEDLGEPSFVSSSPSKILEEELENRLKINTALVRETTKKDPVSFRSPKGFGSNNLMKILTKLNFKIDSSYMQAMHLKRNFPYIVSEQDWKEEGYSSILELPLFAFNIENDDDNDYQKILGQWPRIRTHSAEFVFSNIKPIIETLRP